MPKELYYWLLSPVCRDGSLKRTTTSQFYPTDSAPTYWSHGAPAYLRALYTTSAGTITTTYGYDSPLTTANLTQLSWSDSSTSPASTTSRSWTYLTNGNVDTATDVNSIVTKTFYDANAYPKEVDAAYGLTEQRQIKPTYDPNSGLLTSSTDDNSIGMTYVYDNLGRETHETETGSGLSARSTTTAYDDVGLTVTTTQDQTGLTSTTYYDPLGRVRLTTDTAGNKAQKAYRAGASGLSYELASNPYTSIDSTMGWTLTTRNNAAGVVNVQTYLGADPPAPWVTGSASVVTGTTTTTANDQTVTVCSGPATTVTDQANKTTKYCVDGLGRLLNVTDPAGNQTTNTYDPLNNLVGVSQGSQTRAFQYVLGRVTTACNPETGTAACTTSPLPSSGLETYKYDGNGNLSSKTDARSVTTAYTGYDGLNRPQTKTYTKADGSPEGTPPVTYGYDQDWRGALSAVSTTVGSSVFSTTYTHDGFGRINASTQTTGSAPGYGFVYSYSPADQLTQIKYPSGRKVNYVPDGTGGVSAVQNQTTSLNYASNIVYTPAGGISSMLLNTKVVEQRSWNDRLQLTGLTVSPQGGGTNLLALSLYPCSGSATNCTTGNVGNIQTETIGLQGLSATQTYTYDALSRLQTAGEGSGSWSQTYGIDAYGNRYVDPSQSSGYSLSAFTPEGASNFDAGNHLFVNNALYDPSGNGNQTAIGGYSYTYDAENRMITANLAAGGTGVSSTGYVYDGEGQRVQKITCPAGTATCTASVSGATAITYVYDASGNLAAEYGSGGQSACGTATCYLSVDQIGSTRLVTDSNGNVVRRYDYLPFGEELWAGIGGRTTAMGYQTGPDGFNPKFAGQYRDTESLRDYFNARYYSAEQGRFVSPDPENAGADLTNPQTWNGYAYVGNNPVNVTDPSGLGFGDFLGGLIEGVLNAIGDVATFGLWPLAQALENGTAPGPGPNPLLGDLGLFNCGGPLGTCGTLGVGPWSELSGLGDVQNPGRFIMDFDKNNPFGACMEQRHSLFSVAGAFDMLTMNVAGRDPQVRNMPVLGTLAGNMLLEGYYGVFGHSSESLGDATKAATDVSLFGVIPKAAGNPLTYGRRTSSVMALNLAGKGGLPVSLGRTAAWAKTLGKLSEELAHGLLLDAGFALGEALTCVIQP